MFFPIPATRAFVWILICLVEIYLSTKINGIWEIIVPPKASLYSFNFEDLFLRIPLLSMIFIVAIHGKKVFDLLPKVQASGKQFCVFVGLHLIFMVTFFYLSGQLKQYGESYIQIFLVGGFLCLSMAFVSIWVSCFKFTKSELLKLLGHGWRPVLACFCFIMIDKLFVYSYKLDDGFLSWFAWPFKVVIFEGVKLILSIHSDYVISDMETLQIGTGEFSVVLAPSCAGIQGVSLFLFFTLIFYFLERERLTISKKIYVFLMFSGALCSFLSNIVRIYLLIVIGDFGYIDWALGSFHSHLGISVSITLITGFCLGVVHFYSKNDFLNSFFKTIQINPVAPYLLPFVLLISASIYLKVLTPSWDIWYPVKVVLMLFSLFIFKDFYKKIIKVEFKLWPVVVGILIAVIWIYLPYQTEKTNFGDGLTSFKLIWIGFKIVGSCLLIPVIEELVFRGFLLRFFINVNFYEVKFGTFNLLSFGLTSLIFGLLHQHLWAGVIAGCLFNLLAYHRKSLFDTILCHSVSNILIAVFVIKTASWELWV